MRPAGEHRLQVCACRVADGSQYLSVRSGRDALLDLGDVRPPAAMLLDEALAARAVDVVHVRGVSVFDLARLSVYRVSVGRARAGGWRTRGH